MDSDRPRSPSTPADEHDHVALFVQASELLGSSPDIKEILDRLMDQVIEVIKARRGFVLMREEEEGEWQFFSAREIDLGAIEQEDFRISRSVVERVTREGKSVVTSDALHDQRFIGKTSVSLYGLKSIICVPLIIQGRVLGVIYADHQIETCVFGSREKTLLESIARQAAIAIEHARLYEALKKVHEESMEKARKELQKTQAQLFQSSRMAATGQLAAGIAHELNNPLGAVELTISSMKRQLTEERFVARLDSVEKAIAHCKGIIKKLLHFSRPSQDRVQKKCLSVITADILALMEQQLAAHGIRVRRALQDNLPVMTVEGELSQVIMNILLNARDAVGLNGPERPGEVSVESYEKERNIFLEIADNGSGMEESVLDRIFEPFFTTRPVGEGMGLGLSISYDIIKKHGGSIRVLSKPGKGSRFIVSLPRAG
jgi:C4-dicarboxylate-specific signal transduction histidine kinase